MRPLREQLESSDPNVSRAAELLQAVDPLPESRAHQARVRRMMDQPRRRVGPRLLRPAVMAAILLGLVATAGAAWRVFVTTGQDPAQVAPASESEQPSGERTAPAPRHRARADRAPSGEVDEAAAEREAESKGTKSSAVSDRTSGARRAKRSEAALVQQAVVALRNESDPGKAEALLERYRKSNPGGELAEEAMALRIEAALRRKDARAAVLAREYLARYPRGRFRALAQGARQQQPQ